MGVVVDERGCPVDTDGDGIADEVEIGSGCLLYNDADTDEARYMEVIQRKTAGRWMAPRSQVAPLPRRC